VEPGGWPRSPRSLRMGDDTAMSQPTTTKIYVETPEGLRVPMREVALSNGERVRLYDTSGPGSDPTRGLPPLRRDWIVTRDDVETYEGRSFDLRDDGRAVARRGVNATGGPWAGERRPP